MIKANEIKVDEVTLSNEDLEALNAMDEVLSGGQAGAIISCSCIH